MVIPSKSKEIPENLQIRSQKRILTNFIGEILDWKRLERVRLSLGGGELKRGERVFTGMR